jgi:hypothetical protein
MINFKRKIYDYNNYYHGLSLHGRKLVISYVMDDRFQNLTKILDIIGPIRKNVATKLKIYE